MSDLERIDPWGVLVALLDQRYVKRDELPAEVDELLEVAIAEVRAIRDEEPEPEKEVAA